MTSQLLQVPPPGNEGGDGDPVGRIDREIIREVDLDRVSALIERRSASGLLEELAGIVQALEFAASRASPLRAGIVGRLLGRDLAQQARARQAYEHIRIRLHLAERRAVEVEAHGRELAEAVAHIGRQRARLAEIAERGRGAMDAFAVGAAPRQADAMARRLDHLTLLISSWDIAAAHMRLVRQYGELLLARYAHVRDVVVPQWRRAVEIALTQDEDGDTQAAELLREALESLLQATAPEPAVFPSGKDLRV